MCEGKEKRCVCVSEKGKRRSSCFLDNRERDVQRRDMFFFWTIEKGIFTL